MTEVDQHVEEVLDFDPAVAEVLVTEVKVLVSHLLHSNNLDNKEDGEDKLPGLIDSVEEEALDGIDGLHEVGRDTLGLSSSQDGISTRGEDDLGKLINPNLGTISGESNVVGGDVSVSTGGLIVVARLEALHYK